MVTKSPKRGAVKTTRKKTPARKATAKKATKKTSTGSTRTSSRSAKRRSPKEPPVDAAQVEYERTEFLKAMDKYKRKTGKTFPSWSEVLEVLRSIGWMHPLNVQDAIETEVVRERKKLLKNK